MCPLFTLLITSPLYFYHSVYPTILVVVSDMSSFCRDTWYFPLLSGYIEFLAPDFFTHPRTSFTLVSHGFSCLDFGHLLKPPMSSLSCHFCFFISFMVWCFDPVPLSFLFESHWTEVIPLIFSLSCSFWRTLKGITHEENNNLHARGSQ